jgi:hypothetical protein
MARIVPLRRAYALHFRETVHPRSPGYRTTPVPLFFLIQLLVDLGDLLHPLAPLFMLQVEYVFQRPVEVIGDVGYLLV